MDSKYTQVAEKIAKTFENGAVFTKPKYQWHYFVRRYRIDNDQAYIQPIINSYQIIALRGFNKLLKVGDKEYVAKDALRILNKRSGRTEKLESRKKLFTKDPSQLFYFSLLQFMFYLKTFYLHKSTKLQPRFEAAVRELAKVDFAKWLFHPQMMNVNSAGTANYTYYLQFLGITDLEDEMIDKVQKYWDKKDIRTNFDFKNKIYGYTHLILAASYYYQRTLKREKFAFVLEFFEKNIDRILAETNADIVAEVGLAFRLCGEHEHEVVKKCAHFVAGKFDEKRGIVPREDSNKSLEKAEHRNILAIMLLSDWDRLNLGPNLNIYLREHKMDFFLAEKGVFL